MNKRFYKIAAGIGIALVVLIISFISVARSRDNKIAKEEAPSDLIMSSTNLVEENALSVDTKSKEYNEIENKTNDSKQQNTSTEKKNSSSNAEPKNESPNKQKAKEQANKEEKVESKEPTFIYPVKGEIIADYAKDKLIYSNTLGEWVTHLGIDIKANKTTVVVATAEGTVKAIKNDPRYGLTVVIEHSSGFSTVYSNLLTAEFVSVGQKVKSGQTIGTVGNTASFEILDEPHLHFEMLKNGEQIDPNMYLKN